MSGGELGFGVTIRNVFEIEYSFPISFEKVSEDSITIYWNGSVEK